MSKNNKINRKNKKAQVGETVTWVIATIIIVLILLFSIYVSLLMSKAKEILPKVKLGEGEAVDLIATKTTIAFSLNNQNQNQIIDWIFQENEIQGGDGN